MAARPKSSGMCSGIFEMNDENILITFKILAGEDLPKEKQQGANIFQDATALSKDVNRLF